MGGADQGLGGGILCRIGRRRDAGRLVVELGPDLIDEAPGALDAAGGPLHVAVWRRVGHDEQARGVDAVGFEDILGGDDVLLGLRHLLDVADGQRFAGFQHAGAAGGPLGDDLDLAGFDPFAGLTAVGLVGDHALGEEAGERLAHRQLAGVGQGSGDEAGIEQVQHGVLDAADILIDRHPIVGRRLVDRLVRRRVGKAGEVPGAVDEGIEGVGLALGRAAAAGAGHMLPGRVTRQGIAGLGEIEIVRQLDRQVGLGDAHRAAGRAMDDRHRAAPAALARDAPVAQAIDGGALALPRGFHAGDGLRLRSLDLQPVEEFRVIDFSRPDIGVVGDGEAGGVLARRQDDRGDRQAILAGEVQVALVVRRAAEDRARAVVHQHEVGDPDRHAAAGVERVDHGQAGVVALLLAALDLSLGNPALAAFGDEGGGVGIALRQLGGERMVRGHGQEAGAEQGVRPGGVDFDPAFEAGGRRAIKGEAQPQALGAADPVLLHQPDLVGPALESLQAFDQRVGIVRDAQKPLIELAFFDHRAGAPAAAVDHLLIGQDGHVDRIPVDLALLAVDQPTVPQVEEPGLLLAVVFDVAGGELARPVDAEAEPLQLLTHVGDVLVGPVARRDAPLHRRVLGR